jgi:dTDP-4-dehydrorhamnose reductase
MSRTFHHGERRIVAKGQRRTPTDLRRLARALLAFAEAQAEADAAASSVDAQHSLGTRSPAEDEVASDRPKQPRPRNDERRAA